MRGWFMKAAVRLPSCQILHACRGPSNCPGRYCTHQDRAETKQVVGEDIRSEHGPVALLKVRYGFKSIAGKSCIRSAEAYGHKPAPERVRQHAFCCPNQKKTQHHAPCHVDDQGPVGKGRIGEPGDDPTEKITQVGAENRAQGYPEVGFPFNESSHEDGSKSSIW